jgi:hypothetical protein
MNCVLYCTTGFLLFLMYRNCTVYHQLIIFVLFEFFLVHRFSAVRNADSFRVFGSLKGGYWYEFAHSLAQLKGTGQGPVSVFPLLGSCDVTYGRKNPPMYPYIVAAGCVLDDIRSQPGILGPLKR